MPSSSHPRESDKVETELRRLILTLELEPGLSYSEATLMTRYGWGRTPLREACQRLAEQSLLQIVPRQGIIVTALSVFDFVEMMDAMSLVIGPAAALACRRLGSADLDRLGDLVAQGETAEAAGDFVAVADLDFEFHRLLAEATGNRYLSHYLLHLHQVATRFNFAGWQRAGSARQSLVEHRQIIETLHRRDLAGVKAEMLAHVENARQRVMGGMEPPDA
jgi:DNA-binding GntR family transcriptional regulator